MPKYPIQGPNVGYISNDLQYSAIDGLKDYITRSKALKLSEEQRKDLLEAGEADDNGLSKIFCEVVFKNIPSNSKTYIHNIVLPNHWRLKQEPEDSNIAVFVRHVKPKNKAEKIQFDRDRELDIENTHQYYEKLFKEKLDESLAARISRIITIKELATEFSSFQKLDRLAKTYDLFLSDKQLMANKLNPLPRRLGRRFWVREKKIPVMVKLECQDLKKRFEKALKTEPFYVLGRSSTERIQVGLMSQPTAHVYENLNTFLRKLYDVYGDNVRFLRLRTTWGIAIPMYADLSTDLPVVLTMRHKKLKTPRVVDDFDLVDGNAKASVYPDGTVKILHRINSMKRKRRQSTDESTESSADISVDKTKKVKSTPV